MLCFLTSPNRHAPFSIRACTRLPSGSPPQPPPLPWALCIRNNRLPVFPLDTLGTILYWCSSKFSLPGPLSKPEAATPGPVIFRLDSSQSSLAGFFLSPFHPARAAPPPTASASFPWIFSILKLGGPQSLPFHHLSFSNFFS